jgi:regulator of replication initiation timing
MPAGVSLTRQCPFCEYTSRSDHVNRHVAAKHPVSAFQVAMPDGYTFVPSRPMIVARKVPVAVKALRHGIDVEHVITAAVANGPRYFYPCGYCYECDHYIAGGKKQTENFAPFINHKCKDKVEKPWKRKVATEGGAVPLATPLPANTTSSIPDTIQHVCPVSENSVAKQPNGAGNLFKAVVEELLETDVGDVLTEQIELLDFGDEDDEPVPVDSKEVLLGAIRQAKKADAIAMKLAKEAAPIKAKVVELTTAVDDLQEENDQLTHRLEQQAKQYKEDMVAAVMHREEGIMYDMKQLMNKKDAIIMALAARLGAELGMTAEDVLEFEI